MWKIWQAEPWSSKVRYTIFDADLDKVRSTAKHLSDVVAITPADATEFYGGEGLEDE